MDSLSFDPAALNNLNRIATDASILEMAASFTFTFTFTFTEGTARTKCVFLICFSGLPYHCSSEKPRMRTPAKRPIVRLHATCALLYFYSDSAFLI